MIPYYEHNGIVIYHGDCRDVLPALDLIDTVITDPPYGLRFMGKDWDRGVPGVHFWELILAACKPGAMCLSFGGTRTFHRLTCAIEDAGFEIRDCLMWLYGSGFPKSLNISKAIDKAAGAEREVKGTYTAPDGRGQTFLTAPATDSARLWNGYGTALKPAWEPIILAMNPLDGTFANNALVHGVAGLNIDGGRVGLNGEPNPAGSAKRVFKANKYTAEKIYGDNKVTPDKGRFPANVIHDGSDEVVGGFPSTIPATSRTGTVSAGMFAGGDAGTVYPDTGTAARFFYCAKASRAERNAGCDGLAEQVKKIHIQQSDGRKLAGRTESMPMQNHHPTVKPLALMRYLCRLTKTPTGGTVLDPFAGSGSTLIAARDEGRHAIGIEMNEEYCEIAAQRLQAEKQEVLL